MLFHRTTPREADLQLEGSIWIGIILSAIIYGVYVGLYCLSLFEIFFSSEPKHSTVVRQRFKNILILLYSSIQLILNTFFFLGVPLLGQAMWIVYRDNQIGGPEGYFNAYYGTINYILIGSGAQFISIFLADALLTYRCYIIFGSRLFPILVPSIFTFVLLALGIATTITSTDQTEATAILSVRLSMAGILLTTATNVLVTVMISWRILSVFYNVRKYISPAKRDKYTSFVAIFIESAAPNAILGIVVSAVNTYSSANSQLPWTFATYLTWSLVIAFTQQLIIYRMATGNAWTSTTQVSELQDSQHTVNNTVISRIGIPFLSSSSITRLNTGEGTSENDITLVSFKDGQIANAQ